MFLCTAARSLRDEDEGYTLLELIVVLAILALIMGVAAPMVMKQFSKAKSDTAAIQVRALKSNMEFLYLDMGRYPSESEGLKALIERPQTASSWNGPYVGEKSSIIDPWGRPYLYKLAPDQAVPFMIYSLGADGKEGGDGDNKDVYSSTL